MSEHDTKTSISPAKSGTFVCVTGPSGAGKDTLIQLARAQLGSEPGFLFPRRLVTRPLSAFEDHETLSLAQFEAGVRNGLFALHWRAHGLGYAIDGAIMPAIAAGIIVVCNVSRDSITAARKNFAHVKVVFVTAPAAMIAARTCCPRARRTRRSVRTSAAQCGLCRPCHSRCLNRQCGPAGGGSRRTHQLSHRGPSRTAA